MKIKNKKFYLSILNSIKNKEKNYIINTLCEKTTLFESESDILFPISNVSENLIRLLDNRVQLPLDDLFDVEELTDDDLSVENLEKLEEAEESWEDYRKDHPVETSRQFLSTTHFGDCASIFSMVKKDQKPIVRKPILFFFSKREQEILKEKSAIIKDAKLDDVKNKEKKGYYATSFLKSYENGVESVKLDPEIIKKQLHDMGLKNVHTGFAIGSIPEDIGIIEYDGINTSSDLKHVSFWEYRESYSEHELARNFSFYDM